MSFDLNKIYKSIKTQIGFLANENTMVKEHFTLPPFNSFSDDLTAEERLELNPNNFEAQQLVKYKIDSKEVYDVITDFDESPMNLSDSKKLLRKKYLNILLTAMNDNRTIMKNQMKNDRGSSELVYGQYDAGFVTITRIVKLLIMEIELNGAFNCPACKEAPPCPACKEAPPCPACKEAPPCPACKEAPPCPVCKEAPPCAVCAVCDDCSKNNNMYIGIIVILLIISIIMGYFLYTKM